VAPLAVVAGLNAPQVPAGAQLQVTVDESSVVATRLSVSLTYSTVGTVEVIVTEGTGVMVYVAVPVTLVFETEVAVTTQVAGLGTVAGAV
jgi:hypothetical protein